MRVQTAAMPAPWARAILCVLALGLVAGCGSERPSQMAVTSEDLPDQEVSDFVLTETDQGAPQWTLYARHAATYNATHLIKARDIRVDFFDAQGVRSSELVAREGEINQRSRDMTARGNVVLETTEGTRMSTEVMRFDNRRQKIVVPDDQRVRVARAGDVLTGWGFESDPELRHYEFKRSVQATVRSQSGGTIGERDGR
jgi:LPS export ABC transporter protein LptC